MCSSDLQRVASPFISEAIESLSLYKVIQAVVVPSEPAVCNPDVTCLPVKKRVKVIYALIYFSTPLIILIPLLYPFMNGTPAVIAFLCTYTHKTAGYVPFPGVR